MLPTALQTPTARDLFGEPRRSVLRVPDRESVVNPRVRRYDSTQRVRTSKEYAEVKERGVAVRGTHCLLLVLAKPSEMTRVGFITSKKGVGNAVQRNRARRRLREIVRVRWQRVPATGYWLVLIARRTAGTALHQDLADDVERVLAVAGALQPTGELPS